MLYSFGIYGCGVFGISILKCISRQLDNIHISSKHKKSAVRAKEKTLLSINNKNQVKIIIMDTILDQVKEVEILLIALKDDNCYCDLLNALEDRGNKVKTIIDVSTISPDHSKRIRKSLDLKNINYIEFPQLGSSSSIASGISTGLLYSDKYLDKSVEEITNMFTSQIIKLNSPGKALEIKLIHNSFASRLMFSFKKLLIESRSIDMDNRTLTNVLSKSSLWSGILEAKASIINEGLYSEKLGFSAANMLKDLKLYDEYLSSKGIDSIENKSLIDAYESIDDDLTMLDSSILGN